MGATGLKAQQSAPFFELGPCSSLPFAWESPCSDNRSLQVDAGLIYDKTDKIKQKNHKKDKKKKNGAKNTEDSKVRYQETGFYNIDELIDHPPLLLRKTSSTGIIRAH